MLHDFSKLILSRLWRHYASHQMELIFVIFFIVLIGFIFLSKKLNKPITYRQSSPLFSPAERSFFGVLESAISEEYRALGKIRVADILLPQKGLDRKSWQIAFNKISAKHFDYAICKKDTLEVVAVVELDDKTHNKKSVQARDSFLNSACESANLTLIRFPARASYSIAEVTQKIENSLNTNDKHV